MVRIIWPGTAVEPVVTLLTVTSRVVLVHRNRMTN